MSTPRLLSHRPPLSRKHYLCLCLFLVFAATWLHCEPFEAAYSLTLTAENLGMHKDTFFEENRVEFSFSDGPVGLNLDVSLMGGRRYPAHSRFQMGRYFHMNDASLDFSLGRLGLYGGYLPHGDVVKTPYSLYISSLVIPALNAGFRYTHDRFFFETRWIRLNERSSVKYVGKDETFRDRGLTFKAFGLNFGNLTVGFEDAYLYLDQSFDAESFLLPAPMYLLQMQLASGGRPWAQNNNVNILMGFFAHWEEGPYYLESQLLVDDINASLLAPVFGWAIPALYEIENLSKVAWNVGGKLELQTGTVAFYHGGATKYTFQATYTTPSNYSILPYEYLYYPATEFSMPSGNLETVRYEDNYIGYKHGENNLAFMVEYAAPILTGTAYSFDLETSAEWVINGAKSPANPWHEYNNSTEIEPQVELLCEDVLEHLVDLRTSVTKTVTPFDISVSLLLGYGWNRLELVELVAGQPKIFVPQAGNNGIRISFSVSGRYSVEF